MFGRFKEADYFIDNSDYSIDYIDGDHFTLLNWNIQKQNRNSKWTDEFKHILTDYDPLILLLQECQFIKGLENLLHAEKFGFVFAPNFMDILKNLHSGVLSASHVKHKQSTVIKSYAFEPLIKVPKIFLSTTYWVREREVELLLINIHAINFVGHWKFISQVQQLEYTIRSHNGPVILSGDFNTWNKRRSDILDRILTSAEMNKVDFHNDHKRHIKKFMFFNPLDHIYYKGLDIKETKVIKTLTSDHNPLIVNFRLN